MPSTSAISAAEDGADGGLMVAVDTFLLISTDIANIAGGISPFTCVPVFDSSDALRL